MVNKFVLDFHNVILHKFKWNFLKLKAYGTVLLYLFVNWNMLLNIPLMRFNSTILLVVPETNPL